MPQPRGVLSWILALQDAWIARKRLACLDDCALDDMGLSRADIAQELSRPIWNAPHHWMR